MPQNVDVYVFDEEHASDNVKYKTNEKYLKKQGFSLVALSLGSEQCFNSLYWY